MTVAISVENLSKQYRLGQIGSRTLTEDLNRWWARARRKPNPYLKIGQEDASGREGEYIWALNDVSFDVQQGEVLGIIGRNGAGKSTLLKILSRVTAPTSGQVKVKGRIASLLEVGTGFHPELTGRENIYLNGAILGMKTAEIDRKFDAIVDFSGVEKFIDTPVKRYSSGMYVRLAFAVAAHLEPEILLVDEVLAVGDAEFQKKCLGKMGEVAKEGRTVLFVSHNMGAIRWLTQKSMYLKDGETRAFGHTESVVEQYLSEVLGEASSEYPKLDNYHRDSVKNSPVRITRIWVNNEKDGIPTIIMGESFTISTEIEATTTIRGALLAFGIKRKDGTQVTVLSSTDHGFHLYISPGKHVVKCLISNLPLAPGKYFLDFGINQSERSRAWDVIQDYPLLDISVGKELTHWLERPWGAVYWNNVKWEVVS